MSNSTSGPPPSYDIHASRQPQLYAAEISTYALAVLAVGLRLWCRNLLKSGVGLDDWLIVGALVRYCAVHIFAPVAERSIQAVATGFLSNILFCEFLSPLRQDQNRTHIFGY